MRKWSASPPLDQLQKQWLNTRNTNLILVIIMSVTQIVYEVGFRLEIQILLSLVTCEKLKKKPAASFVEICDAV